MTVLKAKAVNRLGRNLENSTATKENLVLHAECGNTKAASIKDYRVAGRRTYLSGKLCFKMAESAR
jgi:hypothetical protein